MNNFSLLSHKKTFWELAKPFFIPYALYTGLEMLTQFGFSEWQVQIIKFVGVASSLIFFRASYRFGEFRLKYVLISLCATPLALCIWIYPLYFFTSMQHGNANPLTLNNLNQPEIYFNMRLVNSVFLVALFEELLCRVYLPEYLFQAGKNRKISSFLDRLLSPLDLKPSTLENIPFSVFSIVGSTAFFTMGHSVNSYVSAILYFSLTNLLYWKTRSFWVCVLIHALTNLVIALLVKYHNMNLLWF